MSFNSVSKFDYNPKFRTDLQKQQDIAHENIMEKARKQLDEHIEQLLLKNLPVSRYNAADESSPDESGSTEYKYTGKTGENK